MRSLLAFVLVVLSASAISQPILADSISDFSGVQGANGWTYRYYDRTNDPTSGYDYLTDAQLMAQYIADHEKWYVEDGTFWTMLGKVSSHGNGVVTSGGRAQVDHVAIRRWTSDYTGMARIRGEVSKINFQGGNGVQAVVTVNGVIEHTEWIAGGDFVGKAFVLDRPVQSGDAIEWHFDSFQGNDLYDLSYFSGSVAAVPEPSAYIVLAVGLFGFCLRRRR